MKHQFPGTVGNHPKNKLAVKKQIQKIIFSEIVK
jgi:hypothetical protein